MTLCPIALVAGCRNCPIFSVCPVKSVIGDYQPPKGAQAARGTKSTQGGRKTDK
jgi:hypothetical protein